MKSNGRLIIFPKRRATMRDLVMFAEWAELEVDIVLRPLAFRMKPKKTAGKRKK